MAVEHEALIDRGCIMYKDYAKFNSNDRMWKFNDGRTVKLGALQHPGDEIKFQGRAHDLIGFDELTNFTEQQFRFVIGWNRPLDGQKWDPTYHRCRVIATSNPPVNAKGAWIYRYLAPWLDRTHPNPALPGELRFFRTKAGEDIEVESGEPFYDENKNLVKPKSRTVIFGKVEDNKFLMDAGYRDRLEAMPEPLRSKLLYGSFDAGKEDQDWQIIPTEWVIAAQKRWIEPDTSKLCAIGVDVARGGRDKTVITPVYGTIVGKQIVLQGQETPDGSFVAMALADRFPLKTVINLDICGIGAGPYDILTQLEANVHAMNGGEASEETDKSGMLKFFNKRAEWWWRLRELLDPISNTPIALPPDNELLSDLTAPLWEIRRFSIKVEDKYETKKRIGRSPDKADSLCYALARHKIPAPTEFKNFSIF